MIPKREASQIMLDHLILTLMFQFPLMQIERRSQSVSPTATHPLFSSILTLKRLHHNIVQYILNKFSITTLNRKKAAMQHLLQKRYLSLAGIVKDYHYIFYGKTNVSFTIPSGFKTLQRALGKGYISTLKGLMLSYAFHFSR